MIKTDNSDVPILSLNDIKETIPTHAGHVSVSWLLVQLEALVKLKLLK